MWMIALSLALVPTTMGVPCSWVDTNSWTTGFKSVLKLKVEDNLDQWTVDVEFSEPVTEVEAWKGNVAEISKTNSSISNKCYNNMLYKYQCLVLPYIVRTYSKWAGTQVFKFNGLQLNACQEDPCIDPDQTTEEPTTIREAETTTAANNDIVNLGNDINNIGGFGGLGR